MTLRKFHPFKGYSKHLGLLGCRSSMAVTSRFLTTTHSKRSSRFRITKWSRKYLNLSTVPRSSGETHLIYRYHRRPNSSHGCCLIRVSFCYASLALNAFPVTPPDHRTLSGSHKTRDNRCSIASVKLEQSLSCGNIIFFTFLTGCLSSIHKFSQPQWLGNAYAARVPGDTASGVADRNIGREGCGHRHPTEGIAG